MATGQAVSAGEVSAGEMSAGDVPVAGLDGCRSGWVLATEQSPPTGAASPRIEIQVINGLDGVVDALASGRLAAAGIDIPIGLAESEPRRCDIEARRMLGPRRSSVFPAPARSVLVADTYDEACTLSRRACGKGISKQLYNILPKIREVDIAMAANSGLQDHLFEMCPELSFAVLAGAPMAHSKRTEAGRAQRLAALRPVFSDVDDLVAHPPPRAKADDVLDALAGVWTARRVAAGTALRLGGSEQPDAVGLCMHVVA